jgi:RNA polymerase sigma-70 factor (ECF subfamily)
MGLDDAQLTACYRRLERPLYNALYRLLWEPQACMDVMHDACLAVWAKRDGVDPSRVDALVTAAALNLARNHRRWQSLRRWLPWDDASIEALPRDGGDAPPEHVATAQLRAAVDALPWRDREVLVLSEFMGLTTAEIAATLGIPPGTVGSRRHHAIKRLAVRLHGNPAESPNE